METLIELADFVEENFGGQTINVGRRKEITLLINANEFDEDAIYEMLPNWDGSYSHTEELENFEDIEDSVVVRTGLCVDLDGESLIPFEEEDDYTSDDEDDEDKDDWEDDSSSGWLNDDEI